MVESEILGLHNAYREKYEQQFQGVSKTFVQESEVLKRYLTELCDYSQKRGVLTSHKQAFEIKNRVLFILQQYQEQPGLLDPHLQDWVAPVMQQVKSVVNSEGDPHFLMEIIYTLIKIRGFKTIVKFFPHQAADLQSTFEYLCSIQDSALWQSHYVLLIWLGMVVLVPFDLDTIDSNGDLIQRIIQKCKGFLEHTGRPRDASAVLLAKLLTRPDMHQRAALDQFIQWAISVKQSTEEFLKLGVLLCLVHVFSVGQRSELTPYIERVSLFLEKDQQQNTFLRKLKVKLAGRLALVQLRPIVAKWRYQRGSRSLLANLQTEISSVPIITNASTATSTVARVQEAQQQELIDQDVDFDSLETQIDSLLQGLRDRDNIVRWSAAKALGRITGRLQKELGDEIVGQVLDLFKVTQTDSAWHGGCLALAELARRGLLLPSRLDSVFPVVYQALLYDKKQGNHSIGAHVRDAACYLAWSFARAYAPQDMGQHLNDLAQHLLIVALYDRQINCRRAASAAFQEHVGRQGSFPHGIEILTEADYFTLGNRNQAYLQVSCFVAQYPEYLDSMIAHLLEVKLKYWDIIIRQLAACGLSVLVPFHPMKFISEVIPKLIPLTVDNNLVLRNGALLGIGEILLGLAGKSAANSDPKTIEKMMYKHAVNYYQLKTSDDLLESDRALLKDSQNRKAFKIIYDDLQTQNHLGKVPQQLMNSIREIIPTIQKRRLYRGKGGQIIRTAACRFLQCFSKAEIPISAANIMKYQQTINQCIVHTAPQIRDVASAALISFSKTYHNSCGRPLIQKTLNQYLKSLQDFNNNTEIPANIPRGFSLALGCLNPAMIRIRPREVVSALVSTTRIKGTQLDDAQTRTNAAVALGQLVLSILGSEQKENPGQVKFKDVLEPGEFDRELIDQVLNSLFQCMEDYSLDKRGDVGSWVRAAAMQSIDSIAHSSASLSDFHWNKIFGVLVKQLVEKMDRIRQMAGDFITKLLRLPLPSWTDALRPVFVDNREYVQEFLKDQDRLQGADILPDQSEMPIQSSTSHYQRSNLWSVPSFTFPAIAPLVHLEYLRSYILEGIVVSVGGITQSTVRSSSSSLVKALKQNPLIACDLLVLFKNSPERLHVPFLKTWGLLLRDVREIVNIQSLGPQLLSTAQTAVRNSKDILKWLALVPVFTGLLECAECNRDALRAILSCLGQAFPKVRQLAASSLYEYLLGINFQQLCESEADFQHIINLIESTSWVMPLAEVRPKRNEIFMILGMEPPKPRAAVEQQEKKQEEDQSYTALVKEMGY